MDKTNIYIPQRELFEIAGMASSWFKCTGHDNTRLDGEVFRGVKSGDLNEISPGVLVHAFDVPHSDRTQSIGYRVIADKNGIGQSTVSYIGDCRVDFLENVSRRELAFLSSNVVIMESTFVGYGHMRDARLSNHLHIHDIAKYSHLFDRCELLILTHFSPLYENEEIHRYVKEVLPSELYKKTRLLTRYPDQ